MPKESQEQRVLKFFQEHPNEWINGQYFARTMYLTQYHRAIWNLQRRRDRYHYEGVIEPSAFTDEFGFKSYRLNTNLVSVPVAGTVTPSGDVNYKPEFLADKKEEAQKIL